MTNSCNTLSSHADTTAEDVSVPDAGERAPRDDADVDVAVILGSKNLSRRANRKRNSENAIAWHILGRSQSSTSRMPRWSSPLLRSLVRTSPSLLRSKPPAEQCNVCDSAITLRCAALRGEGKLQNTGPTPHLHPQEILQGASAGCRDCSLIFSIFEHFLKDENELWRVRLRFAIHTCDEKLPELKVWMEATDPYEDSPPRYMLFEVFRSPASPSTESQWSNIVQREYRLRDNSSEQAFRQARSWLQKCLQTHEQCSNSSIAPLPKRILEITATGVNLREHLGEQATYACLSHCWGTQGPALQLTSHKVSEFKRGIARAHLPRTFRDAVDICENFDIKFLWIDALCILQDNLADWASTAQVMASIYENAYLTIAATGSNSTDGGCFSPTSR
ncbi:heterokaryon incompatibility protein-domain-containing protein [Paraphoma chrysanthemicola]|nr:heterokaryon incompatibility protein-domain-containing protein [Paraphoma chrysanthemicola]